MLEGQTFRKKTSKANSDEFDGRSPKLEERELETKKGDEDQAE